MVFGRLDFYNWYFDKSSNEIKKDTLMEETLGKEVLEDYVKSDRKIYKPSRDK